MASSTLVKISLTHPNGECHDDTRRIWSLWDLLNKFHAHILVERMAALFTVQIITWGTPEALADAIDDLTKIRESCSGLGLPLCAEKATRAIEFAQRDSVNYDGLTALANDLHADIQSALAKRIFLWISDDRLEFLDNFTFMGEEVPVAFPEAKLDIREAGNCLASECTTAAVFHLMRVSEYGLRMLARRLKAKITHKGKTHPIEFADWEKVITEIKTKIAHSRTLSPGPKKQAKLELYSDAADHSVFMKDIWRNNISHARRPYNRNERFRLEVRSAKAKAEKGGA